MELVFVTGKSFGEINARFLCKTLCNQSGLVVRDFAGGIPPDTVDPFETNQFAIVRSRDKLKSINRHDGLHFVLHSGLPLVTVNRIDGFLIRFGVFAGSKESGGRGELAEFRFKLIVNLRFVIFII